MMDTFAQSDLTDKQNSKYFVSLDARAEQIEVNTEGCDPNFVIRKILLDERAFRKSGRYHNQIRRLVLGQLPLNDSRIGIIVFHATVIEFRAHEFLLIDDMRRCAIADCQCTVSLARCLVASQPSS